MTGAGHLDIDDVARNVERIKSHTALPVCVGFGIKDADSARKIAEFADGVVIGSAIVDEFAAFEADSKALSNGNEELLHALHERFSAIANALPGRTSE